MHAFENPARIDNDPEWRGRVFEAIIGAALTRCFAKFSYWRDANLEVDFIVEDNSTLLAIEVKSGAIGSLRGLTEFKKRCPNATTLVLNEESGEEFLRAEDPAAFLFSIAERSRE